MKYLILVILSMFLSACSSHTNFQTLENEPIAGNSVVLTVYGMSCPLCSNNLDGQIEKIEGTERINIDLDSGDVTVLLSEGHAVTIQELAGAVKAAGFTLAEVSSP